MKTLINTTRMASIKTMCIYKITSTETGKIYIGSTSDFRLRINSHYKFIKIGKHNKIMQNHATQYGTDDLVFSILEVVDNKNDLLVREQHYIDILNPELNVSKIAGKNIGVIPSEKTRKKMSVSQMGNTNNTGKKQSEEAKSRRIGLNKGSKRTEYQRRRISENRKGIGKLTPYIQYIKDNIKQKSQIQIAKELNVNPSAISYFLKRCG